MVKEISQELIDKVIQGGFISCAYFHDHSCEWEAILRFFRAYKASIKFYASIHIIPLLLFRSGELRKDPKLVTLNTLLGILRSTAFMSSNVTIFRYLMCLFKNTRRKMDHWNVILAALLSSVGLLIEPN